MDFQTPISQLSRVGAATAKKLAKLGLNKAEDLLYYYPFRYEDWGKILTIAELKTKKSGTIRGKIHLIANHRSPRKKMIITEAIVSDKTDSIKVVWFNQPFLATTLRPGTEVYLAGKVDYDENYGLEFLNPSYEFVTDKAPIHTGRLVPVYPTTSNLSQKQIRSLIRQVLPLVQNIEDWLPREIRTQYNLPTLSIALEQIHFPSDKKWLDRCLHRLKFDELFLIQLQNQIIRQEIKKQKAPVIKFKQEETQKFVESLPFQLTNSQRIAAWEILKDLEKPQPMNRLLEGDVGSGKTVVAMIAVLNVFLNGYQTAYMAPTEILAHQHYETFNKFLKNWPIKIALLTHSEQILNQETDLDKKNKIKKTKILEKIKNGEIDVLIGTHALIQENVLFKNLGLVIIDEQHRFGVEQRALLVRRSTQIPPCGTQINTDTENKNFLYKDLTYKIRGAIFKVYNSLGPGFKESTYQKSLEEELIKSNLKFEKEKNLKVIYNNKTVGNYKPDFIIEGKVIVEIKTLPFLGKIEEKKIWSYLKNSGYKLALLVNFGSSELQIKRIIYDKNYLRKSEFDLNKSEYKVPHLLSMTATPIPRSLALTLYGDLDLSIINEMPKGRKAVITQIVKENEIEKVYQFIREQIKEGRQAFVICPLIDPSDTLGVKSVKEEYKKLKDKIFPDFEIALLHGRLKAKEKEKIMKNFLDNKINILVSTTVVEVGVDVPNASIMMIEGAERFGLAQLYQLKGRVGRSNFQSYCFLFTENPGQKTYQRLKALLTAKNGFELAEKDLEMRGPGEIFGTEQSGYLETLKIAKLTDSQIIKEAQEAAVKILNEDPELKNYPLLKKKIKQMTKIKHLE